MNLFTRTLRQHYRLAKTHLFTSLLTIIVFFIVIYSGYTHHQVTHSVVYIIATWLCAYVTDLVVNKYPKKTVGFPIKRSLKKELPVILICTALGGVFLVIRFLGGWQSFNPMLRLTFVPLIVFAFPIVLAIIYFFVFKYRPKELGINLNYWYLPIFIHILYGTATLVFARENAHWLTAYHQLGGPLGLLYTGLITAALSEEFTRVLLITRLSKFFNNNMGLGIFLAAAIWASLHIPNFGQDDGYKNLLPATIGAVRIIPLGLLWGYITCRTKSIVPSIFIHGFNLWGLQWY